MTNLIIDTAPSGTGLIVQRSEHWGYNSIGIVSAGEALAVDPGITPDEITAFRDRLMQGGRHVPRLVLTHSHHDHIRGWNAFDGAEIVAPIVVSQKPEDAQTRILAGKNKFDRRLGVEEPDFTFPEVDVTFEDRHELTVGTGVDALRVICIFLPGHSNCTSVVVIPELKTILTADYLVFPGLPYCRWEAAAFETAHEGLLSLVDEFAVERAVPAHNEIFETGTAVRDAIEGELEYFRVLRTEVERLIATGAGKDEILREGARKMRDRRGVDLGLRARQDVDNVRRVLAEIRS